MRPREEYDEPWEWSQTHSMIFDQMGSMNNDSQQSRNTPLMTKRTNTAAAATAASNDDKPPGLGEIVAEAEKSVTNMSLLLQEEEKRQQQQREQEAGEGSDVPAATPSPDVQEVLDPAMADVLEVVEEPDIEYENMKDDYDKPVAEKAAARGEMNEEEYERYTQLREEQRTAANMQCPENDKRTAGNYEEPWDLSSTQKDLEDRIKAHVVSTAGTSGGTLVVNSDAADTPTAQPPQAVVNIDGADSTSSPSAAAAATGEESPSAAPASAGSPSAPDTRTQEGYEKPWDWKPHKKDDRGQEGYEKPWDWKPHQKDDRPGEEYEQPWDNKVQNIEENLMKAKAKDNNLIEKLDNRPCDEYEEPWDQRKKAMLNRTGKTSHIKKRVNVMSLSAHSS